MVSSKSIRLSTSIHASKRTPTTKSLMRLLLKLDSMPGVDLAVRQTRRNVSRRIVGLQEIVDLPLESISSNLVIVEDEHDGR
ncbi:hypothetical protein ACFX13_011228 [Malus domestica]